MNKLKVRGPSDSVMSTITSVLNVPCQWPFFFLFSAGYFWGQSLEFLVQHTRNASGEKGKNNVCRHLIVHSSKCLSFSLSLHVLCVVTKTPLDTPRMPAVLATFHFTISYWTDVVFKIKWVGTRNRPEA